MQRAEQIMSQAATKEEYDQFNDDIDDDELCRVNRFINFSRNLIKYIYLQACNECDELYNASQAIQSQQQELCNFEQTDNLTQNSVSGLKRKRLGVSTTPNERRAMIKKTLKEIVS
jgi:hypothetical protein